jgi:ribosomal protein S21
MKKALIALFLLVTYFSIAQEAPEFPEYNARNAATIFYYKFSEIPKEIKVKKDITKNKTITELRLYNDKIKKISFLNTPKLQEVELMVNSLGAQLYSNRDLAEKVKTKIESIVLPVRDSVAVHEKVLNDALKSFLSKRQFKKWLKYQRAEKRELVPKPPRREAAPPQSMNRNRNRNRQGMGGRRF